MGEEQVWRTESLAKRYIEGVRGGIPLAEDQLDTLLRVAVKTVPNPKVILDLGCGDGILGRTLGDAYPKATKVFSDFSEPMLAACKKKLDVSGQTGQLVLSDYGTLGWESAFSAWAPFDLVVSGFSIHHQTDRRKREIYREIFGLLKPGGLFLNLEHVVSASAWGEETSEERFVDSLYKFHQAGGSQKTRAEIAKDFYTRPDKAANILAPLELQCGWLREIGFVDVDCFFKVFELALFGGLKPKKAETLKTLPDYSNLDLSGEARSAAERMEARSQEPASEAMFEALVAPLLSARTKTVLDLGCGTAALARRISKRIPDAKVFATDKSLGMLQVAKHLGQKEGLNTIAFAAWDVTAEAAFPLEQADFDLIVSSVMVVYLTEAQVEDLILRLSRRLKPGGILAFIEQDWMTDALNGPSSVAFKVLNKEQRIFKRTQTLGLRSCFRKAGLRTLPRTSFLWTDDHYGIYTRELLERFADAKASEGGISVQEAERFKQDLKEQAANGDFYYGLVYHCVAAMKV